MLARLHPGFLLLFWCGIAATIVALPLMVGRARAERVPLRQRVRSLALDLLLFPPLYALTLEALGRADLITGAGLGAAHALLVLLLTSLRAPAPAAPTSAGHRLRVLLARTLYGTIFAFLYVVPAP